MSATHEGWQALPDETRAQLCAARYDQDWFRGAPPPLARTLLNLWVALAAAKLWHHVAADAGSGLGALNVDVRDPRALRAAVEDSGQFAVTDGRDGYWQARERRVRGALHIKHFTAWPAQRVQFHIDPTGSAYPRWWWCTVLGPLATWVVHLVDYYGYRDVERIARILRGRGL